MNDASNPSHLVKWMSQFYEQSSQPGADLTRLEIWTAMRSFFHLDEAEKSNCFQTLYTALSILQWNTKTRKVRGKKILTGIVAKKPRMYFTSYIDRNELTPNHESLFIEETCIENADFVCGKEESKNVVIATKSATTAFLLEIPIVTTKWISDCIAANAYICYEKYALCLGSHKHTSNYKDILQGYAVAFHNFKSVLGLSQEWAAWAIVKCGGKVVDEFEEMTTDVKIVISSRGNVASELLSKTEYIVGELWLLESIAHGLQSLRKFSMQLSDPMDKFVTQMGNFPYNQSSVLATADETNITQSCTVHDLYPESTSAITPYEPLDNVVNEIKSTSFAKKLSPDSSRIYDSSIDNKVNQDISSAGDEVFISNEDHVNMDRDESVINTLDLDKCTGTISDLEYQIEGCDVESNIASLNYEPTSFKSCTELETLPQSEEILTPQSSEAQIVFNEGEQFNNHLYQLRKWSNDTVYKYFKMSDIHGTSLKETCKFVNSYDEYLNIVLPDPGITATEKRKQIYMDSGPTKDLKVAKLRSFTAYLFPPVVISTSISSLCPDSQIGDRLPQFSIKSEGKRNIIKCIICPYWQQVKKRNISSKYQFEGILQMCQHGKSKFHKDAFSAFTSSTETKSHTTLKSPSASLTQMKQSMSSFLGIANSDEVACHHIYNPDIVEAFKDDQLIHRMSTHSLFKYKNIKCEEHHDCICFDKWKANHPDEYQKLKTENVAQASYVPLECSILVSGSKMNVHGAIQSNFPPCKGTARKSGKHAFTCISCQSHFDYLKDLMKKRKNAKLKVNEVRHGKQGMKRCYLTKTELQDSDDTRQQLQTELSKENQKLTEWITKLERSIETKDDDKFTRDLKELFRTDDGKYEVQLEVIRNLVYKLKRGRNHHFTSIIKSIGKMQKNMLGAAHYSIFEEILGFPSASTVGSWDKDAKFELGINEYYVGKAADKYQNKLIVESSDGARVRRSLDARLNAAGRVSIIGKCWDADPDTWPNNMVIPQTQKAGEDQYDVLEDEVKRIINQNEMASHVCVHNLNVVTDSPSNLVFGIWPMPNRGLTANMLYKIHQKIRTICATHKPPLALIGHSTDSAGYCLSLALSMMTPQKSFIDENISYLGLGIPEERHLSPYFWKYPTIYYLDFEHNQRSSLRQLKYPTLDLVLYEQSDFIVKATIDHLQQLRNICLSRNITLDLTENDLILMKFFDQNSDAAYKIFSPSMSDLLVKYIPEALGTAIYIKMIYYIMQPYRSNFSGSPLDVVESVATGLSMLRMWRRCVEIQGRLLNSKPNAATEPQKRGSFITSQTYNSLEIQVHAAIYHQLALFLHSPDNGVEYSSPRNASTISTEKFIGQSQSKTSHIQSLNTEPSAAETIDRASQIQYNLDTMAMLQQKNITVRATSNRKKHLQEMMKKVNDTTLKDYSYPANYVMFRTELREAFYKGVKQAQDIVSKLLPTLQSLLLEKNFWDTQYTFQNCAKIVTEPPKYNKLGTLFNHTAAVDEEEVDYEQEYEKEDVETHEQFNVENITTSEASEDLESFYIYRKGKKMHVGTALKLAIGTKDVVRKERKFRHWVPKHLPNLEPIPASHNVAVLRNYIVQMGSKFIIVKVISINENGKRVKSTESKSTAVFQGSKYEFSDNFQLISKPEATKITKWLPVKYILFQANLLEIEEKYTLTDDCKQQLNSVLSQIKKDNVKGNVSAKENTLEDDEYFVENVLECRLDKTSHEYEYLVKWKGYDSSYNEWVSGNAFKEPITVTLKSQRGRDITHTINPGEQSGKRKKRSIRPNANKKQRGAEFNLEKSNSNNGAQRKRKLTQLSYDSSDSDAVNSNDVCDINNIEAHGSDQKDIDMENEELKSSHEVPQLNAGVDDRTYLEINDIVCPWQGQVEGRKLHNTCTVDTVLSSLFIEYIQGGSLANHIAQATNDHVCDVLKQIMALVYDGKNPDNWTAARMVWLERIIGIDTNIPTIDLYGNEEDLVVRHLQQSTISGIKAYKTARCDDHKRTTSLTSSINVVELLDRGTPVNCSQLPLENLIQKALTDEGCVGNCRKCDLPATVNYKVDGLPPLLILRLFEFLIKNANHNQLHKLPKIIKVGSHNYKLCLVTTYKEGHFNGYFIIKEHYWLYDPFRLKNKKAIIVTDTHDMGDFVMNYVFYKKN